MIIPFFFFSFLQITVGNYFHVNNNCNVTQRKCRHMHTLCDVITFAKYHHSLQICPDYTSLEFQAFFLFDYMTYQV